MNKEELRDYIWQKEKEGVVVLALFVGYGEIKVDDLIKQPAEGILYDLNRDSATVMTYLDEPKWVNDYAVGVVIKKLKSIIEAQGA